MEELSKLLGFATPVLYAGATFLFFDAIDRRASKATQAAISSWMKSSRYDREAIASALREIFDRIYGPTLLSWQTFGRVAAFSLLVQLVTVYELDSTMFRSAAEYPAVRVGWGVQVFTNVSCDYASVFFIRKWIDFAGERALFALFTGLLVGIVVIRLLYVFLGIFYITDYRSNVHPGDDKALGWIVLYRMPAPELSLAAYAIHLRLPLLATALLFGKIFVWLSAATQRTQSFFRGGQDHPILAVGCIAASTVFAVAMIVQRIFPSN
jgi:hypothetical protein